MMKMYSKLWKCMLCMAAIAMVSTACNKKDDVVNNEPVVITPEVRPVGVPDGAKVTKQIGAEGGELKTADNAVTITIPAGALNAATAIGIEPVTNTNPGGLGKSYRLTPHGQQFAKPVSVKFSYAAYADSITLTEALGVSYQADNGVWMLMGAQALDKTAKTITWQTTHFSDWALMEKISLIPYTAELKGGESRKIQAQLFATSKDDICNCPDDVIVPLNEYPNHNVPGLPVGLPFVLPSKYIKEWKLIGPGKISATTGSAVIYQAPESITVPAIATVVATLNAPVAGQYMLVATIKLEPTDWIELSIGGAAPVRFPATPVVKMGNLYLLSNPDNEGGGYFLLRWEGGVGSHGYNTPNMGGHFHWQTPNTTYISMYRPDPKSEVTTSGGSVNITKLGNGRVEGTFTVTPAGFGSDLTGQTSASGRFKVTLAP